MVLKSDLKDANRSCELSSSKVKRSGRSLEEFGEMKGGAMTDKEEEEGSADTEG